MACEEGVYGQLPHSGSLGQPLPPQALASLPYCASSVVRGHGALQAVGAVDDEEAPCTGCPQLLQQVRGTGPVAGAEGLHDHPLQGRLQEGPDLGVAGGKGPGSAPIPAGGTAAGQAIRHEVHRAQREADTGLVRFKIRQDAKRVYGVSNIYLYTFGQMKGKTDKKFSEALVKLILVILE